jgi:hypothetical protein
MAFLTNNTYNGKYKPFENDNNILLYSYLQNSKFLEPNKEYILNEFKEDLEQNASFDYYNDDVVLVHVRLGDFFYMKRVLSFSYYESILEKLKFKKLYIVTDQPNHEYIEQFKKYNIDLSLNTGDAKEKFLKAQQFKRIVMSTSTYCWWFTFLSKATEIYIPDIENSKFFKTGINIDPYSPYYLYLNDSVRIKTKYISS